MSISVRMQLIVGAPYSRVVGETKIVEEETRYDNKTGKPYKEKICHLKRCVGKMEFSNEHGDLEDKLEKLGLVLAENERGAIIGAVVCKTADILHGSREILMVTERVKEAKEEAIKAFRQLGFEDLTMNLYLVPLVC